MSYWHSHQIFKRSGWQHPSILVDLHTWLYLQYICSIFGTVTMHNQRMKNHLTYWKNKIPTGYGIISFTGICCLLDFYLHLQLWWLLKTYFMPKIPVSLNWQFQPCVSFKSKIVHRKETFVSLISIFLESCNFFLKKKLLDIP